MLSRRGGALIDLKRAYIYYVFRRFSWCIYRYINIVCSVRMYTRMLLHLLSKTIPRRDVIYIYIYRVICFITHEMAIFTENLFLPSLFKRYYTISIPTHYYIRAKTSNIDFWFSNSDHQRFLNHVPVSSLDRSSRKG